MRRSPVMLLLVLLLTLAGTAKAQGQGGFAWYPGGTYSDSVPTPQSVLGYAIGDQFTFHHQMKAYMDAVDAASDRVMVRSYGRTNEGRELLLVFVSSPANLARLDAIQANMGRLSDPRGASRAELDQVVTSSPAVAWLSYNVHGNESSSTEAAIQVVYQLAAGTDADTRTILDQLVVIIDPLENPDGRDRYVASYTKRKGMNYDAASEAWEHGEDWPGGRSNHYYFDLNRDWAWQTQVETKQRIAAYLKWNPVVHVDFHEMGGSSYFFFPADKPIHSSYPDEVMKWQKIYGQANAAAFDHFGWPYYTRETFDLYYPSYGDSWPSMMGAIGMTYEQGGGGGAGVAVEQGDDYVHTLRQRAHGHFTTSMATLKVTAEKREERLRDFLGFFQAALAKGDGPVKTYALIPGRDGWNVERLVGVLTSQGIEVSRASASFRAKVAVGYTNGRTPDQRDFPAGTWLVEAGQPKGIAVEMLLEPRPALEDTSFYDLSAWSLPMAYNVEAYGLGESPKVARVSAAEVTPSTTGGVQGGRAGYAYLLPYEGPKALLAAAELLNEGVRVKAADDVFTMDGRTYPKGSFVIPNYRNPDDLYDRVERITRKHGINAWGAATGLVDSGTDLGAGAYHPLRRPRIAVAAGENAGSSFGEIWNFLDQQFPLFDYTNVDAGRLGGVDLEEYTVLILSGRASFSDAVTENIRAWASSGGVVIAFGGATRYAQSLTGGGGTAAGQGGAAAAGGGRPGAGGGAGAAGTGGGRPAQGGGSTRGERNEDQPAVVARQTMAEREQERRVGRAPQGLYEVVYDPDHFLAFGQPERMAVLHGGATALPLSTRGVNVAVFSRDPLLSGYAPADVPQQLSRQAWLVVENVGRGKAVLFADDPLFRLFVEGEFQPLLNAIILGPSF